MHKRQFENGTSKIKRRNNNDLLRECTNDKTP